MTVENVENRQLHPKHNLNYNVEPNVLLEQLLGIRKAHRKEVNLSKHKKLDAKMGVLEIRNKGKTYLHELEIHTSRRKTELPVEKLGAVFIESAGRHLNNKKRLAQRLNESETFWHGEGNEGFEARVRDILQRAKNSGTEIWLGDVKSTEKENRRTLGIDIAALTARTIAGGVLGGPVAAVVCGVCVPRKFSQLWLARKGTANKRRISRQIATLTGKITPTISIRDVVMGHKIKKLSELTNHQQIGILTGAGHVGMADILEKEKPLTEKQRSKIAARGSDALKMFRCIYDKTEGRWRVEEHSL